MLGSTEAMATIPVKDMDAARRFYEGTLGLKQVHAEDSEAVTYRTGDSTLLVYKSGYAGTNEATAVTWIVEDLEGLVEALKGKGISFEHYDLPGTTREGHVHVAGGTRVAWFKDPDGNIHSLVNQ